MLGMTMSRKFVKGMTCLNKEQTVVFQVVCQLRMQQWGSDQKIYIYIFNAGHRTIKSFADCNIA